MEIVKLNGCQRIREKDAARQADDDAVSSGHVSVADMRRRNELLHDFDMAAARIELGGDLPVA